MKLPGELKFLVVVVLFLLNYSPPCFCLARLFQPFFYFQTHIGETRLKVSTEVFKFNIIIALSLI